MLRTRLWMGSLLALLGLGVLVGDRFLTPYYPFLLLTLLAVGARGVVELRALLGPERRPGACVPLVGVCALVLGNWLPLGDGVWRLHALTLTATLFAAFFVEMAAYREPGRGAVERAAFAVLFAAYLGLPGVCLAQLGRLPDYGTLALGLAFFAPKAGDIAAYFTGHAIGRHKMAPILSPKKTWEGAAGGFLGSVGATLLLTQVFAPTRLGWTGAAALGAALAVAGQLGDLVESMIKRDCQAKDASASVPGFGGILDVVDSILLAAPVAYWWLS